MNRNGRQGGSNAGALSLSPGVVPTTTQLNLNVCGSFPSLKRCLVSSASRGLARLVISPPEASRAAILLRRQAAKHQATEDRAEAFPSIWFVIGLVRHAPEHEGTGRHEVVKAYRRLVNVCRDLGN